MTPSRCLGRCHLQGGPGTGVRYDVPRAMRLLRRAKDQGVDEALQDIDTLLLTRPEETMRRCSRPGCGQVKAPGSKEARYRVCSGCSERHTRTHYCSEACQAQDWRRHFRVDRCGRAE